MKIRKLKSLSIVILLLAISFMVYVQFENRNSKNMTSKQKVLKALYPIFTGVSRILGKNSKAINNEKNIQPAESLYQLSFALNNGRKVSLSEFKGRKVLLVNTASDCGYTGQYAELQNLYQQHKNKLIILAFPANDFKEQEKRSDEEIEKFCTFNFGVSFPLAAKSVVVRSEQQNEVFRWLTDKTKNGWNSQEPSWNFSKYLVNEQGVLTHYFDPAVSPQSEEVIKAITN